MGKFIDLTGQRFGKWTVIGREQKEGVTRALWLCQCDCGKQGVVTGKDLRAGKTKSCGCTKTKHGGEGTTLYRIWHNMKVRCLNPNSDAYPDYGGRGITICNEWKNDFGAFREWALSNGYKDGLSIDRKENDKGYSPDNCRWTTMKEQCNNRRSNLYIEYNGEVRTAAQWAEIKGIPSNILRRRIQVLGWKVEKALETPVKKYKKRGV